MTEDNPWAVPDAPYGSGPPPTAPRRDWLVAVVAALSLVLAAAGFVVVRRVTHTRATASIPAPSRPADGIPIRGRVLDDRGRPVSRARLQIATSGNFAETFARAMLPRGSDPYGWGVTDGSGRYTVYLKPGARSYTLGVSWVPGVTVTAHVAFTGRAQRLPDLVVWAPDLSWEGGHVRRVTFGSPPRAVGSLQGADLRVVEDTDGLAQAAVLLRNVSSGVTFDVRVLEDREWVVALTIRVGAKRLGEVTYDVRTSMTGTDEPASRGKPCVEYDDRGRAVTGDPCALTDGDLSTRWQPTVSDSSCGASRCDRAVAVDLGSVKPIAFVVVRVCDPFFDQVESSADGRHWTTLVRKDTFVHDDDDVCSAVVSTSARYVRVRGPAGGFYTRRTEISVF